jgi:diadenosine tetraphosphate (Ap4A) HIT family hydrolase
MARTEAWRQQREHVNRAVADLRRQGICATCHDLATGEPYGNHFILYEDDLFKVTLEPYPRARGHTIVVYKPHRADLTELSEEEAGRVFQMCLRVANAIKRGLGAEKVYLNTMCDGPLNHLHLQLFPRYAGDPIGSRRFVAERRPLTDGEAIARNLRSALAPSAAGPTPVQDTGA